ncbi:MAG TPA: hypothetical protein VHV83_05475, partial [Armatimonadota bacterium]|nr:hypothetical protein [Armatimonadota bacterium]
MMTRRICYICILVSLLVCGALLPVYTETDQNFFDGKMVNTPDYRDWRGRSHDLYANIITNIPREDVMGVVCGDAMLQIDRDNDPHCVYYPLASVGKYGKKKNELLPFDPRDDNETIVIIDRSKLSEEDKTALGLLIPVVFSQVVRPTEQNQVLLWLQNNCGKEGREYQALIDLPDKRWLKTATNELRSLPVDYITDGSKRTAALQHEVSKTVILCNDEPIEKKLVDALPYSDTTVCNLDSFDTYRDDTEATRKIIALNWNSESECPGEVGVQIFPTELAKLCKDHAKDRVGLTGWQRYCRLAQAKRYKDGKTETWVIGAPTSAFLGKLVDTVIKDKFKRLSYQLPIVDLSFVKSLSVGVYVVSADPDRQRLVLQQQLEDVATETLNAKVAQDVSSPKVKSMVTTQNWGDILKQTLGNNQDTDDPFTGSESVRRVNQASNSDAILLLWVKDINPSMSYSLSDPIRLTERFPAFAKKEPSAPDKPDPDDKKLFSGHTYPGNSRDERQRSDKYQRDLSNYYEAKHKYDDDHEDWENARREWVRSRDRYRVNYNFDIQSNLDVKTVAFVKVIDLVADQRMIWSTEVDAGDNKNTTVKTIPVEAIGDTTIPAQPDITNMYRNSFGWSNVLADSADPNIVYSLGQNTLSKSLRQGIEQLAGVALWYGDLKP